MGQLIPLNGPALTPAIAEAAQEGQLPELYVGACVALSMCVEIDECKEWADKAEAIASYARQVKNDELGKMAKRIKNRANRRMGELLEPIDARGGDQSKNGDAPIFGRREAAEAAGLSKDQQVQAVRVANVPDELFEELNESEDPPTVTALAKHGKKPRGPIVDLHGRDPHDFNRALHFGKLFSEHLRDLDRWDLDEIAPCLIAEERAALRQNIERINAAHAVILERIGHA
jgi:hypothetical protein